jgi:hypothetical protein
MRLPLIVVVAPLLLFFVAIVASRRLDPWSLAAGVALATGLLFVIFVRDAPPHHVANWGLGAEGERKTEKVLLPLEQCGWSVEHDVQRNGRANLDHIVTGQPGVFLLETKNLNGTVAFEYGMLITRQFDDPDAVYRHQNLAARLRGQADELSARLRTKTGRHTKVAAAVVIWGHFPAGLIEHGDITYVGGDRLVEWLTSL